jgi:hypothetical protein
VNIQSHANNAKIYFGEKIPSVLLDGDDGTKGNADLLKMMDADEAQSDKQTLGISSLQQTHKS